MWCRRRSWAFCLATLLAAVILIPATFQAQNVQSPREAALELFFAPDSATVQNYLLESTKAQLQQLGPEDRRDFMQALMVARNLEKEGFTIERVNRGQTVLLLGRRGSSLPVEVTLESEQVEGDLAVLQASAHKQGSTSLPIVVRMKKEKDRWRLARAEIGTPPNPNSPLMMLEDPEFAEKVKNSRRAANERVAVANLRTLVTALLTYSFDKGGYPVNLAALAAPDNALIDPRLASGESSGYRFLYESDGKLHFTLRAHPRIPRDTGNKFFFTDETGTVRFETGKPGDPDSPAFHGFGPGR